MSDQSYSRGTTQCLSEHRIGKGASETEISNLENRNADWVATLEFFFTDRIEE